MGVLGGVPNSFVSKEEYRLHALEQERKARVFKIQAAINEFTGGDSAVLYHAIEDLKISLDVDCWSYDAFKRTFDIKTLHRATQKD